MRERRFFSPTCLVSDYVEDYRTRKSSSQIFGKFIAQGIVRIKELIYTQEGLENIGDIGRFEALIE